MNGKTRRTAVAAALLAPLSALAFTTSAAAAPSASVPAWLHAGSTKQYPSSGGTWEYGFWNAYVRSYYTVNRCHGSSVDFNGNLVRSANTASGYTSIAEKFAWNYWSASDAYYYRTC